MARPFRTRISRTVITIVVAIIAVGAAIEFHRYHKTETASARTSPSSEPGAITANSAPAVTPKPAPPARPAPPPATPGPFITQTPDPSKTHDMAAPLSLWATNQTTPITPVGNTVATGPGAAGNTAAKPADSGAQLASAKQIPPTGDLLAQTKSLIAGGDMLTARKQLNDALLSGSLSEADTQVVKKQISDINKLVVFSTRQFPKDPFGGVYTVKNGERMASIGTSHGIPFELLLPLNDMKDARKMRYGQTLKVLNGPFHVVVTKSKFTLDVYLGSPGGADSMYITTFRVGLGTDNSTPTGTWVIKNKVKHPAYFPPEGRGGGVIAPEDPKNPLGPYWLGLEGTDGQAVGQRSYGIHGTIDPDSIGKQSSMGCIRLHNEDIEVIYNLLVPEKSTVIVKN